MSPLHIFKKVLRDKASCPETDTLILSPRTQVQATFIEPQNRQNHFLHFCCCFLNSLLALYSPVFNHFSNKWTITKQPSLYLKFFYIWFGQWQKRIHCKTIQWGGAIPGKNNAIQHVATISTAKSEKLGLNMNSDDLDVTNNSTCFNRY